MLQSRMLQAGGMRWTWDGRTPMVRLMSTRKKEMVDTDFLKRRRAYDERIQVLRHSFAKELRKEKKEETKLEEEKIAQLREIRIARVSRRREKSLARVEEHRRRVDEMKQRGQGRATYGFARWQKLQEERMEAKQLVVGQLEAASTEWVTDSNLDLIIETVVDEFTIIPEYRSELAQPPVL